MIIDLEDMIKIIGLIKKEKNQDSVSNILDSLTNIKFPVKKFLKLI